MIKEKRRKRRRQRNMFIASIVFMFSILVIVLIIWNVYTVQNIVVEGNKLYSGEQIKEIALDDEYSWNSLYVLLKAKFGKKEPVPFVDTMEISLDNPHTVHVVVYEKGSIGYVYLPATSQNAYFDKDGFVIETSEKLIKGIPRVEGLNCDKVVLYEKLPIDDSEVLREVLVCTQALKKYDVVPKVITIDSAGKLVLDYENIRVNLGGSDNLTEKIMRIPVIMPDLEGKTGTLHIEDWTMDNKEIIFREEAIN